MRSDDLIKLRTEPRASTRRALMISGMHRSGTSALTRVLNLCGVELGSNLMTPGFDNPTGFWECQPLVDLNDQLLAHLGMTWDSIAPAPAVWDSAKQSARPIIEGIAARMQQDFAAVELFGVKDPRLSRLWPFWMDVFSGLTIQPCAVIAFRHPLEVAASLSRREGFDTAKSLLLWLLHVLEGEAYTRGIPRVYVNYQQLLSDWRAVVANIDRYLGLNLFSRCEAAGPAVREFLAPGLRHHRAESILAQDDAGPVLHLAMEAYALLPDLETRPVEAGVELDRLRTHLLHGLPGVCADGARTPSGNAAMPATDSVAKAMPSSSVGDGVSVIIPVFNQPEYVRRCLDALFTQTGHVRGFEVIVVDNASDESTRDVLSAAASRYPALRVIRNERNRLFAPACNQGARAAHGDVLIFLNSDTEVQSGWFEAALARLQRSSNAGIVGARMLYPDGTIQHGGVAFVESEQGGYDIWPEHRFRYRDADDAAANRARRVAAVTGACMILRRAVYECLGGFDEDYGMYFEDTDLCMRARERGFEVWYEPAVCVVHAEGVSTGERTEIDRMTQSASRRFFERWGGYARTLVESDDLVAEPPPDLVAFGERALSRGSQALARRSFERALETNPRNVVAHNDLAVLYWQHGDAPRALRHLAIGLATDPAHPELVRNAVTVLKELGELQLAQRIEESHSQECVATGAEGV